MTTRRSSVRRLLAVARDPILTLAAVAMVLACTFGPFETRNDRPTTSLASLIP